MHCLQHSTTWLIVDDLQDTQKPHNLYSAFNFKSMTLPDPKVKGSTHWSTLPAITHQPQMEIYYQYFIPPPQILEPPVQ